MSEREAQVLEAIRRGVQTRGYAPSVRELCESLGYRSTSTVQLYLDRLTDKGYIRREGGKSRSISLCREASVRSIPILSAGADPFSDDFDGRLDFCYCGELAQNAPLLACRARGVEGFAVILRTDAEEADDPKREKRERSPFSACPKAFCTATEVLLVANGEQPPQNAKPLGYVIACLQSFL